MSDESIIPCEQRAARAEDVGILLGLSLRTILEKAPRRPDFLIRQTVRTAT